MSCIEHCGASYVIRNYVYLTSWDLRERSHQAATHNEHYGYATDFRFNAAFYSQLGSATNLLNTYANSAGHGTIQWIGTAGSYCCKPGCHSSSKAFDLSHLQFTNTAFDMNKAWRSNQPLAQQRGYLAIWADLRMYCKTVLTNTYNADHENHIHVDNDENPLAAPPPIRTVHTDTTLVQTACNLLNGASLSIDGVWGPATTQAYNSLLMRMRMHCLSPKTNFWDARLFLSMIAIHGFANASAGVYTYPSCGS